MPSKSQPKFLQLLLKVQKQTIFVTVPQTSTIGAIKEDALSALTDAVNQKGDVPAVTSVDDFELCRAVKEKMRGNRGEVAYTYEPLDTTANVKVANVQNWETLYLRFKDNNDELAPVNVTHPSIEYEYEEGGEDQEADSDPKGKRKAVE
ncbi:hypothetical protein BDV98DRAFT_236489 [Pterulicium gracile]|uniref:Uncharacterized protein n=1 Tax=Pterulicium gracile TaxID=1884261 RepID=A0A5C3QWR3_9AGAR|nr:hypothetical protein BDV98DRAFT_236489 [Pterula gracilis]